MCAPASPMGAGSRASTSCPSTRARSRPCTACEGWRPSDGPPASAGTLPIVPAHLRSRSMPIMSEDEYRYNRLMQTFTSIPEPAFESPEMQKLVWGREWGCPNDVGQIRVILMHRPGEEVNLVKKENYLPEIGAHGDPAKGWYWRGNQPPDLPRMQAHHDGLAEALRREGVRVEYLQDVPARQHKSVSTRDSVVAVRGGAIVCRLA